MDMKKAKFEELEESPAFPIEAVNIIKKLVEEKEDRLDNMTTKEVELYCRIYPFTPNEILERKFNISKGQRLFLNELVAEAGIILEKDPAYLNTRIKVNDYLDENKSTTKEKHPGYIITELMRSVSEEERVQLQLMYEEGIDPINLMKEIITMQAARVMRGFEAEQQGSGIPLKTMNEASIDLHTMIKTLHEFEEGKKLILGVDDSFAALVQQSQIQEEDDWK